MFTDGPVTPLHVESVIDFLRLNSKRKFSREDIKNSFQPESVAGSQEQITRAPVSYTHLTLPTKA